MASKNLDTSGNASEDVEMGAIPTERRGKHARKEATIADKFFKLYVSIRPIISGTQQS